MTLGFGGRYSIHLSYDRICLKLLGDRAILPRLSGMTSGFGGRYSIHLSYDRIVLIGTR